MNVKFPQLEKWQEDCFQAVIQNYGKWIVVKSRRQVGKSALLKALLLYSSLKNKGAISILCSPVISQSRKIFEEVVKMGKGLVQQSNASLLSLTFINGSKIEFVSAEQGASIRGKTVKNGGILVVDEAAFVSDDFFYGVLVPTTNVYKASIVLTSSPFVKQGFFYELYSKPNENTLTFDWCNYDTSKYLSKETLEIYRTSLPRRIFQTEYLGEFADGESYIFGDFKECIKDTKYTGGLVFFGIDWGTGSGNDYTVISVLEKSSDKIKLIKQVAFNDKGVDETIEEISRLDSIYKPKQIIVERNSIGNVYLDIIRKKFKNIKPFDTTNDSKNRIINKLSLLLERRDILLVDDRKLISELSFFQSKVTNGGKITFSAPNGMNDDRVMSLAIGLTGFDYYNYNIK